MFTTNFMNNSIIDPRDLKWTLFKYSRLSTFWRTWTHTSIHTYSHRFAYKIYYLLISVATKTTTSKNISTLPYCQGDSWVIPQNFALLFVAVVFMYICCILHGVQAETCWIFNILNAEHSNMKGRISLTCRMYSLQ